jgi:hypothetical protein
MSPQGGTSLAMQPDSSFELPIRGNMVASHQDFHDAAEPDVTEPGSADQYAASQYAADAYAGEQADYSAHERFDG